MTLASRISSFTSLKKEDETVQEQPQPVPEPEPEPELEPKSESRLLSKITSLTSRKKDDSPTREEPGKEKIVSKSESSLLSRFSALTTRRRSDESIPVIPEQPVESQVEVEPEAKVEAVVDEELEAGPQSTRTRFGILLKDGMAKGKLMLQHTVGLGHKPNVIPPSDANVQGEARHVELGWHPVAGFAGKWFAESTGLGKMITERIAKYPDPTQHWGVLVGNYCHQLWMDENMDVIYINEEIKREEWRTYPVGKTRFNDEALRQASEMVIYNMRQARPAYNLISNNCQNFAILLLDAISVGAHREFGTTFAIYQRATGKGAIKDLFVEDKHPDDQLDHPPAGPNRTDTVQTAVQVMEENTTQLDTHKSGFFS